MNWKSNATLYFVAALLFAIATGLNFANDGLNIKTVAGCIMIAVMTILGLKIRRAQA